MKVENVDAKKLNRDLSKSSSGGYRIIVVKKVNAALPSDSPSKSNFKDRGYVIRTKFNAGDIGSNTIFLTRKLQYDSMHIPFEVSTSNLKRLLCENQSSNLGLSSQTHQSLLTSLLNEGLSSKTCLDFLKYSRLLD